MTGTGDAPPIDGAALTVATAADAAELLVLQRCCWVAEAIANDTLDIAALHESLADVAAWIGEWSTWCVRGPDGRLVGRGLGRWLLQVAEAAAPPDVGELALFTGARSVRSIARYERAGYRRTDEPAPPHAVGLVTPR